MLRHKSRVTAQAGTERGASATCAVPVAVRKARPRRSKPRGRSLTLPVPYQRRQRAEQLQSRFVFVGLVLLVLLLPLGLQAKQPVIQKDKKQTSKKSKQERDTPAAEAVPLVPYDPGAAEPPRPANGSLFTDMALNRSLLSDFKATNLGDLVFIDVIEASAASVSSGAKRSRDSGTLGGVVGAVGAIPAPGAAVVGGVLGGLGQRKFEGKGETGRSSRLDARITARVIEVLPNGDFRVEAQKIVKINKEDELLTLSGIVRRRDVSAENAVPTTMVGDLRVQLNGKGVASADNAPGWLFRLFDKISPF